MIIYNVRVFASQLGWRLGALFFMMLLAGTAAALGACLVERHITIDRAMWGSDQAASVEPQGVARLVRDIRIVESALGDGVKRVYDSEIGVMKKLRRVPNA